MKRIVKEASAGTVESSDVLVHIAPNESGIEIDVESVVLFQFGDAIRAAVLETLKIGYEVVLEADRAINTKGGTGYHGQTCLKNATVVVNNYGNHPYPTTAFKGEISVADFYNLDITKDYTTSVFTMKATVVVEETPYYTNIFLSDGTTKVRLYSSSANQYSWLKVFAGQEVTVEIAACNWNDKDYYTGCVLAVINADGSKTLNELNFQH